MDHFTWRKFGHWCGFSAGRGNPCQVKVVPHDKVAVFAPTATVLQGAVAQQDHLPFLNGDLVETSSREKPNPLPVWGKERNLCSFPSRELRGLALVEPPSEQFRVDVTLARDRSIAGHVHQPGAVWRENGVGSTVRAGR